MTETPNNEMAKIAMKNTIDHEKAFVLLVPETRKEKDGRQIWLSRGNTRVHCAGIGPDTTALIVLLRDTADGIEEIQNQEGKEK